MGKRHKGGAGERASSSQQTSRSTSGASTIVCPQPDSSASKFNINGGSYFPHPMGNHRMTSVNNRGARAKPSSGEGFPTFMAHKAPNARTNTSINAELKLSLAAKTLTSQIDETRKCLIAFQNKFESEVDGIKYYAGDHILRQTWQKRIEYYEDNNDENQDDEEFSLQKMKLETCLEQVNDAGRGFVQSRPPGGGHDPRHLALEKIYAAGNLVLGLSAKSMLDGAACGDLVTEISNLEKLVDPKSPDAKVIHRFSKREASKSTHEDGDEDKASAEPANPEDDDQPDEEGMEADGEGDAEKGDGTWDEVAEDNPDS